MVECVVVGAGPGGLGVAAELRRRGIEAVVLERGDAVAARWRARYDRLRINTSALTSFPPRGRFPVGYGRWPTRDQLVEHYERYARMHGIDARTGIEVRRVDRHGEGWAARWDGGELAAGAVVVATGKDGTPLVPDWPGRERFAGQLIHAADYRNAKPFAGRRAVVVGAGSSALDICVELAESGARDVALSIRTPPHLARRAVAGVIPADVVMTALHRLPRPAIDRIATAVRRLSFGDLAPHGLPLPSDTLTTRVLERGMIPTIDPGPFVPLVKEGRIRVAAAVEGLHERGVLLAGGDRLDADVVIAATGYARGLEPLVGHLGVLDDRGHPRISSGDELPHAPGLHFIGFTDVLTGNLRELRLDARRIARSIARRRSATARSGLHEPAADRVAGQLDPVAHA